MVKTPRYLMLCSVEIITAVTTTLPRFLNFATSLKEPQNTTIENMHIVFIAHAIKNSNKQIVKIKMQ